MKNLLREKIMNGEKTVGTFFEAGNASVAEALALTDLDYMLIDTEHGPFDVESVMLMLRGAELHGTTALVRVKDSNRNSILKMLDIGAGGLIIPQVHSLEEIKKIVEYGKYFPVGQRGVAFARGAGYGYLEHAKGDINDYFATCNRETLLIPQCETKGCLENIEEIAKVDAVTVKGDDIEAIQEAFKQVRENQSDKPGVLVLDGVKGSGVKCIEKMKFNHMIPVDKELADRCLAELEAVKNSL